MLWLQRVRVVTNETREDGNARSYSEEFMQNVTEHVGNIYSVNARHQNDEESFIPDSRT